jgi:hypothetical protein
MTHTDRFRAIESTLSDLLGLLEEELLRGAVQTTRLAALDAAAAFDYARSRAVFTAKLEAREAALTAQVAEAAKAAGLGSFQMAEIERRHPQSGARLILRLQDLARSASAVRRQDTLNVELARRARACVNGWLRALTGPPAAYTRRGAIQELPAFSTAVRVA